MPDGIPEEAFPLQVLVDSDKGKVIGLADKYGTRFSAHTFEVVVVDDE